MKTVSLKAWASKQAEINGLAQARLEELLNHTYRVEVMDEDIEEESLRLCRVQVQFVYEVIGDWEEAGEQLYAEWRGWI